MDNTSLRKLAHIQKLILLNSCYIFLTDTPVGTFSYNMRPVSTTGPKIYFILFLHFSRTQLLADNLEKCLHLVLALRFTTRQLMQGHRQQILA